MTSYTQTFGGQNINPADLSYLSLSISADTTLVWPLNAPPGSSVVADKIDVTPSGAGLSLIMPDATKGSNGADSLIRNLGASSITVKTSTGVTIATVASGQGWLVFLRDNTTASGTWGAIQYGAGTSSADAASLAGLGLVAISTTLNQSCPVSTKNSNYTITSNDRAALIASTGGALTFSFSTAASLGNNWFVMVRNDGSGALTLNPSGSELIDGATTITLNQTESCMVVSDGTQFRTIGRGRSVLSTVSAIIISGGGGAGTQTLTTTEIAAQVQQFNGTLTGSRAYEYGTAPGYWFVYNNLTLGGFTATWRVNAADAGVTSASLAAGSRSILVSNGTNMFVALTTTSGTVTSVATGTGLTGGPITSSGTIALANTAVTLGSYRAPNLTIDAQGRITAASNFTPATTAVGSVVTWNDTTGTLVADSGAIRVDMSGNVGIGTSSPSVLLDLAGTSTTALARIGNTFNGAVAFDGSGAGLELLARGMNNTNKYAPAIKFGSTDVDFTTTNPKYGAAIVGTAAQTYSSDTTGGMDLEFWTAPTNPGTGSGLVERMRIESTGRLKVSYASNGVVTALTDGATITPDFNAANNFSLTIGGNRTLANPTNQTAGQSGAIVITQDGTGGRTLAYGSNWKFAGGTAPTINSTANAVSVLLYYVESATRITAALIEDSK